MSQLVKSMALALLMTGVGYMGYNAYIRGGLEYRLPGYNFNKHVNIRLSENLRGNESAKKLIDGCDFIFQASTLISQNFLPSSCFKKSPEFSHQILLWGDSYAQMLTYGLIKTLPSDWQLLQVASRGCQPSIYEERESFDNYCKQNNYFAMRVIKEEKPEVVIISQNSNLTQENASLFSKKLHELGVKHIIFVGKPPQWNTLLPNLVFRKLLKPAPLKTGIGLNTESIQLSREVAGFLKLDSRDRFISLVDLLCDQKECQIFIGDNLEVGLTSLDDSHLTPVASEYVARLLLTPEILRLNQ